MRKEIFVLGLDPFHLRQLEALGNSDDYRFHELYQKAYVKSGREDVAERLLTGALKKLADFEGSIDAIVGYWNFPVSTMLPLLRRKHGLRTPSFESVLKCEHKYWSRLEQARVIPEHMPEFCAVDPFDDASVRNIPIGYPFWIKPVKSVLSYLGFKVHNDADLERAIASIRAGIARIATPFNYLLQFAELPETVAPVDGRHCIVESIISKGRQCTLEGYAVNGDVVMYGAVDSIRGGVYETSFNRYQYPSTLPTKVLSTMADITRRFLCHIGFSDSPFNIEFYWDEASDRISLLEVNTRISRSHGSLLKMVDGEFHHRVMLDVALGRRPDFPYRQGEYPIAAKFMWRAFEDAVVSQAPSTEKLADICEQLPGTEIELHVAKGSRLSELFYQDSYSYELAAIFVGGDNEADLMQKYDQCRQAIGLRLDSV